jgi:hypothetical protein
VEIAEIPNTFFVSSPSELRDELETRPLELLDRARKFDPRRRGPLNEAEHPRSADAPYTAGPSLPIERKLSGAL